MSIVYIEKFIVNGHTLGISKDAAGRFQCWSGGCGIGSFTTMPRARDALHGYIVSQVRAEAEGHRTRLSKAEIALEKLGDDPFYLGRFIA